DYLKANEAQLEQDKEGRLIAHTLDFIPAELHKKWRRVWVNSYEKGSRQRVPALMDTHNPGLTGGVQNQPDYQAGIVDHRVHFQSDVLKF
ncbi:hypothetical protein, partial [Vibrio sp. 10N.222.49.C9]